MSGLKKHQLFKLHLRATISHLDPIHNLKLLNKLFYFVVVLNDKMAVRCSINNAVSTTVTMKGYFLRKICIENSIIYIAHQFGQFRTPHVGIEFVEQAVFNVVYSVFQVDQQWFLTWKFSFIYPVTELPSTIRQRVSCNYKIYLSSTKVEDRLRGTF